VAVRPARFRTSKSIALLVVRTSPTAMLGSPVGCHIVNDRAQFIRRWQRQPEVSRERP